MPDLGKVSMSNDQMLLIPFGDQGIWTPEICYKSNLGRVLDKYASQNKYASKFEFINYLTCYKVKTGILEHLCSYHWNSIDRDWYEV